MDFGSKGKCLILNVYVGMKLVIVGDIFVFGFNRIIEEDRVINVILIVVVVI